MLVYNNSELLINSTIKTTTTTKIFGKLFQCSRQACVRGKRTKTPQCSLRRSFLPMTQGLTQTYTKNVLPVISYEWFPENYPRHKKQLRTPFTFKLTRQYRRNSAPIYLRPQYDTLKLSIFSQHWQSSSFNFILTSYSAILDIKQLGSFCHHNEPRKCAELVSCCVDLTIIGHISQPNRL